MLNPVFSFAINSKTIKKPQLPLLLQEVEKNYAEAGTLVANFSQTSFVSALKQTKISSGRLMFKHPGKIRWETLKPDPNLFVSDGVHFWFYTPPFEEGERGQVIKKKSSQIQSKLANALLSGSFSTLKEMKINKKDKSHFQIFPKPGSSGNVSQAEIEVDTEQKWIKKVVLEFEGGNHTEISLSEIQMGKVLENALFIFITPKNTDQVK